ncbi:hypothetical protein LMG18090_00823 [Ralstonia mannitolilytica]|uniref:DUF3489 domain-containing protein n=2 Tax=Burkholderiaceae TaxID=119060 RepID=UPI000AA40DA8|nr:DUF3489 domain-containing protein [Ralstonia pickettii]CAJ0777480.1 hypothetical protein LMG18090_00823 [Ralstonia mannitolilytica]CAJ0895551.1 hypothetical protein R6138_03909 [Ralstonia sp. LMG 18095]
MNKSPTPKAPGRASTTKSATGPEKSRKGLKATQAKAPASASRRRATKPPPAAAASEAVEAPATKQAQLIALLKQASGASLADLTSLTGWQAHSVRGVISGVLRKRLQLPVISETVDGIRRYRISVPV